MIRLQKFLSKAGTASRREAERLILEGRVTVNGEKVLKLGIKINPEKDRVKVDNKLITLKERIYLILNKPCGYLTSLKDPLGRPLITDLLPEFKSKIFPVGRLDYDAEGLILLTNDGELAQRLMHPRYQVPRAYLIKIKGILHEKDLLSIEKNYITSGNGVTKPPELKLIKKGSKNSWLKIIINEGKNSFLKRTLSRIGLRVIRIIRIGFDGLSLYNLPSGYYRYLTEKEISNLFKLVHLNQS